MATTLTSAISSTTTARYQNTTTFGATFSGQPRFSFERQLNEVEASKLFFNTYSVTTTPTSIDLTALTDAYGNALSFTSVRHLAIKNASDTIGLTVGGGTNGLFAALPFSLVGYAASSGDDGSCLQLTTTIAVDGTHKILTLTAASGTIAVDVMILGL